MRTTPAGSAGPAHRTDPLSRCEAPPAAPAPGVASVSVVWPRGRPRGHDVEAGNRRQSGGDLLGDARREIARLGRAEVLEGKDGESDRLRRCVASAEHPDDGCCHQHGGRRRDQRGAQRAGPGGRHRGWRWHDRRIGAFDRDDGLHEPVAALLDRLDVRGALRVVAERLAELRDGAGQGRVGDELLGPHGVDDRLPRDDLPGPAREQREHVHGLGAEVNDRVPAGQPVQARLDEPLADTHHASRAVLRVHGVLTRPRRRGFSGHAGQPVASAARSSARGAGVPHRPFRERRRAHLGAIADARARRPRPPTRAGRDAGGERGAAWTWRERRGLGRRALLRT